MMDWRKYSMQINRLFQIVYVLLDKKTITARELAERFEVSVRTIYRDVDILSTAGIPIYTNKGKGGGISLLADFILNKSVLSAQEQDEILMSLQSLYGVKGIQNKSVLDKLGTFFNKELINWIDVDFSSWGSGDCEQEIFDCLKLGILSGNLVNFDYYSATSEKKIRVVEPLKLVFKGRGWYLYGYCREKEDFRLFKITRIKNCNSLPEIFQRRFPDVIWERTEDRCRDRMITLVLKIDAKMEYRLYDEFDESCIVRNLEGDFVVTKDFPEDDWVYGYILSYGDYAEVLQPVHIREVIKRKFAEGLKKYL